MIRTRTRLRRAGAAFLAGILVAGCGGSGLFTRAAPPAAPPTLEEILDLHRRSRELDARIAAQVQTDLRPAVRGQRQGPVLTRLLKDGLARKWRYVAAEYDQSWELPLIQAVQDLFLLCGIEVLHDYPHELRGRPGMLRTYIEGQRTLRRIDPRRLSPRNHVYLARHQVLDWLVSDLDQNAADFVLAPDGTLVGLDKTGAFEELGEPLLGGRPRWYYRLVRRQQLEGKLPVDFEEPQGLVAYVQSLPPETLLGLFEGVRARRVDNEEIRESLREKQATLLADLRAYYEELARPLGRLDELERKWAPEAAEARAERVRDEIRESLRARIRRQEAFLAGKRVTFL